MIEDLNSQLQRWNLLFSEYVLPRIQEMVAMAKTVYEASWKAYLEIGAIYGETHEGMMRWLEEIKKIEMWQAEIDNLRDHHQMLSAMRRKVKSWEEGNARPPE